MKHKQESPITLIIIGLLVLALWLASCCTLQHQKGFRHYQKNEVWKN